MSDFGVDVSVYLNNDLDPMLGEMTGGRVLLEAIARRLETPSGLLPEDAEYGYDARQLVNGSYTPAELAREARRMAAQCELDERVLSADVTLTPFVDGRLTARVSLDTQDGPFELVLDITAARVFFAAEAL